MGNLNGAVWALVGGICLFGCTASDTTIQPDKDLGLAPSALKVDSSGAYLGAWSAVQGGSIDLYVSSPVPYSLELRTLGISSALVWQGGPYSGVVQTVPTETPWQQTLNWVDPVTIPIAANLPSAYYQVNIKREGYAIETVQFVVREDNPGSTSPFLVLDNATTRIAYNNWGGKSAYANYSSGGIKATTLAMFRPGQNKVAMQQKAFQRWALSEEIPVEWASSMDWHNDPHLFDNYETVILVEHSEYWTKEMRDQLDAHLARGGNLFSMSGNTAWWQIRIEGDKMVIYKSPGADPLMGVDDELVTTNFYAPPVNDPENSTTGVSYRNGGLHNNSGYYMAADGYGGYEVQNDQHPLFSGTGLGKGDMLGKEYEIVGYEVDGAEFEMVDGAPVVTGNDGTPPTMEILATAPAGTSLWEGHGTFVAGEVGTNGGQIVNTATVYWADGLWDSRTKTIADVMVSKVTLNALAALSPNSAAACQGLCHPSGGNDSDLDGYEDKCDNCVSVPGSQADWDQDGTGNLCDTTP